ncbi:hypothetical protein B0H16DRAFT_1684808 [Mycena metata]|uniref:DUF6697 domain-containing protein n=1 Tax=Mycena metata TaxID=1033252 RepID=A0AAD7K1J3_9AGAR|nr:hypothetical protein B0H16DRAFT_1684808 [Mycena metata]
MDIKLIPEDSKPKLQAVRPKLEDESSTASHDAELQRLKDELRLARAEIRRLKEELQNAVTHSISSIESADGNDEAEAMVVKEEILCDEDVDLPLHSAERKLPSSSKLCGWPTSSGNSRGPELCAPKVLKRGRSVSAEIPTEISEDTTILTSGSAATSGSLAILKPMKRRRFEGEEEEEKKLEIKREDPEYSMAKWTEWHHKVAEEEEEKVNSRCLPFHSLNSRSWKFKVKTEGCSTARPAKRRKFQAEEEEKDEIKVEDSALYRSDRAAVVVPSNDKNVETFSPGLFSRFGFKKEPVENLIPEAKVSTVGTGARNERLGIETEDGEMLEGEVVLPSGAGVTLPNASPAAPAVPWFPSRRFFNWRYLPRTKEFSTISRFKVTGRPAIFADPSAHPFMPTKPQAPGALLTLGLEIPEGPITLFSLRERDKGGGYEYLGEYTHDTESVRKLTPEEYTAQGRHFYKKWADDIEHVKAPLELRRTRARIALRKAGASTTATAVDAEVEKVGNERLPTSRSDVIDAFKHGQEQHDVVRFHCVSYDHGFVQQLAADYPAWKQHIMRKKGNEGKQTRDEGNGRWRILPGSGR